MQETPKNNFGKDEIEDFVREELEKIANYELHDIIINSFWFRIAKWALIAFAGLSITLWAGGTFLGTWNIKSVQDVANQNKAEMDNIIKEAKLQLKELTEYAEKMKKNIEDNHQKIDAIVKQEESEIEGTISVAVKNLVDKKSAALDKELSSLKENAKSALESIKASQELATNEKDNSIKYIKLSIETFNREKEIHINNFLKAETEISNRMVSATKSIDSSMQEFNDAKIKALSSMKKFLAEMDNKILSAINDFNSKKTATVDAFNIEKKALFKAFNTEKTSELKKALSGSESEITNLTRDIEDLVIRYNKLNSDINKVKLKFNVDQLPDFNSIKAIVENEINKSVIYLMNNMDQQNKVFEENLKRTKDKIENNLNTIETKSNKLDQLLNNSEKNFNSNIMPKISYLNKKLNSLNTAENAIDIITIYNLIDKLLLGILVFFIVILFLSIVLNLWSIYRFNKLNKKLPNKLKYRRKEE